MGISLDGTCIGDVVIEDNVINISQIMSNRCPNCGNDITPEMKFCGECGTKLKCGNGKVCGKTIQKDFALCPYCGTKVQM
ncbi:MAG: zinc ribbon domain-containing protein [Methanosarcinales archaeon]